MDKFEDYDVLYGYSSATGVQTEIPNTLEDVANYIVREGLTGDVLITTPLDTPVLNTMGFFIDQCVDSEYMEALRPVLIEKQSNLKKMSRRIRRKNLTMTNSRKCDTRSKTWIPTIPLKNTA